MSDSFEHYNGHQHERNVDVGKGWSCEKEKKICPTCKTIKCCVSILAFHCVALFECFFMQLSGGSSVLVFTLLFKPILTFRVFFKFFFRKHEFNWLLNINFKVLLGFYQSQILSLLDNHLVKSFAIKMITKKSLM